MGASRIDMICKTLIKYGMDASTPAAAIENATLPIQRTITARLDEIADTFNKENFHAPVIIMISPTISLRKDICWFEKKPLFSKRLVIAGAAEQRSYFYNLLSDSGGEILYLPVMKTKLKEKKFNLYNLFSKSDFEWILFTNDLAVNYFFEILRREKLDSRIFGNKKIAAIGKRTSEVLHSFSLIPDFDSAEFVADSFKHSFINRQLVAGKKILRIQNDLPYDRIYQELIRSEVTVDELNLYDILQNKLDESSITKLNDKSPDIFIFSEPHSIDFFFGALGTKTASNILTKSKSIIFDPATPEVLLEEKFNQLQISAQYISGSLHEVVNRLN